jgi:hypothetical protein
MNHWKGQKAQAYITSLEISYARDMLLKRWARLAIAAACSAKANSLPWATRDIKPCKRKSPG